MNITDTLIRLRDDLKEWVRNNIQALHTITDTEISGLKNKINELENKINELENK